MDRDVPMEETQICGVPGRGPSAVSFFRAIDVAVQIPH